MNRSTTIALLTLLAATPATAGEVVIPTEQEKIEALKKAYRLNGNSMVGLGYTIDLTDPAVAKADRVITTKPITPTEPKAKQ